MTKTAGPGKLAAAEQVIDQGDQGDGGRIINAASSADHTSHVVPGTYDASRFSVRALTHVMAQDFAQYGITVNS